MSQLAHYHVFEALFIVCFSIDSLVPATTLPFSTGVKHVVTVDGENVRCALVRLMTAVQARMLADKSDDTKCFEALIQVLSIIMTR